MQLSRRNFILYSALFGLAACSGERGADAGAAAALSPPAAAPGPVRNVAVELFTSQGCSSCPPADAVLARLAEEPGVVVLSRPVTYWDRLGWPDEQARPENDALQLRYNGRFGEPGRYYTPQAVVQGGAHLVGSNESALRERIIAARASNGAELRIEDGTAVLAGSTARPAELRLVLLRGHSDVAIGGGENSGRRVRYTNVVVGERVIGRWAGGAARVPVPADALRGSGADRAALLVQEPDGGAILAAAYL